ncbi:MAG: anti-sigma factor [Candidatus Promineifilaceae bacterium]|nr:zf-HC2 domain-containing protein [Anaerolineaceae bacterium]
MKCEELLQYLSDYIDQELDDALTTEAQEHLATCHNCRVVLDSTQQTIFLFREQGKRSIPAQSRSRLFDQLQDAFLTSKTS